MRGASPGERRGGRTKGAPNKASAAKAAEVEATGLTPLDYMLEVMRDEGAPLDRRDDMAKAAAPYVHPKLASTTLKGDADNPLDVNVRMDAERFTSAVARISARSGKSGGAKGT